MKNIKHLLALIVLTLLSTTVIAQNDVTKFLGIPVDGYKQDMIQKLKAKGYTYDKYTDMLEGEFNGTDVMISVVTNNNKVYRIFISDAIPLSETDIKIRFNKLCEQFENNSKYVSLGDQTISDSEDIEYNITVNNKRYQASFCQRKESGTINMNSSVWFMIDEQYGKYKILMYYDNGLNQANGEDL